MNNLIKKLYETRALSFDEWVCIINHAEYFPEAREIAELERDRVFGRNIYVRGLLEFSSYCRNDCLYCGLRRSNEKAERYRLTEYEILESCKKAWKLGFRTVVLQGGEDPFFTDEKVVSIVKSIKNSLPEMAVTLSIGEKPYESYRAYRNAGADRYLLRHESADNNHYSYLHPSFQKPESRKKCLENLKSLGYQTGAGFMVGSPGQTAECLAKDMLYLKELNPEMIGIGPFIPHKDTPFRSEPPGSFEKTLYLLSLIRIMLPEVLLPATTALGALKENGREAGIEAGANVLMPNITPERERKHYNLYNNKPSTGLEDGRNLSALRAGFEVRGYHIPEDRGDAPGFKRKNSI